MAVVRVGVLKEIKPYESRVALIPAGASAMVKAGHEVWVEAGSGIGSGFADSEYERVGARIVADRVELAQSCDMIMKVKDPLPSECALFHEGQILFTYLHLAADPALTQALLASRCVGIAYETVQLPDRSLPLLTPMSEVAGRMAVQIGAHFLEKSKGGRGVLLGGIPGVHPGEVVIIGGGVVGTNAAKMAVGLGADVTVLDISAERLRYLDDIFGGRLRTVIANEYMIASAVERADLLIGAVLVPGARAPKLVTEEMVQSMKQGAVIVDVAIDQGGSIATVDRVTTHADPIFVKHGVVHYSVANMPGAVPRTSTYGLTNVTLPYALRLAEKGWKQAVRESAALAKGVNLALGHITYEAVATAVGMDYTPLESLLSN